MTTLSDVLRFIKTADDVDKTAIKAALGVPFTPVFESEHASEYRYHRSAAKHERALDAIATLAALSVGQMVNFPYNGVNYTGQITKINKVKAKVRITEMDGAPTRKGVCVGEVVGVPAAILARKN